MDMARRRVSGVGRSKQPAASPKRGEKRRLVQLVVSLCLFFIVFFGQGAFPAGVESLSLLIANDADFSSIFSESDMTSFTEAVRKLTMLFGTATEPQGSEPPEDSDTAQTPEIVMLSQTDQCGLAYLRQNSFLDNLQISAGESTDAEIVIEPERSSEPAVVTAVAQAYSPTGEALPANVSFQHYELGLEKTVAPVLGTVTSEFGYRIGPISGKKEFHLALDIAADKGTEIQAFADGVVRYIGENPNTFGLYVMIDHANGVSTFYAHCSKLLVRKGEKVTCGQVIALVGETGSATGPHLHFTLAKDSVRLDPAFYVDPS